MTNDEYEASRTAATDAILRSNAHLKLVVAGPGTGKTFTFQKLLGQTAGKSLALTFLMVLVRDLETKFDDSVDVRSFHGFARRLLHQLDIDGITRSVHYYPPLVLLVVEDLRILNGTSINVLQLGALFRGLADGDPLLRVAISSGNYYDSVSHDDAVYRVLRTLQSTSDVVPQYAQIVVDEFQDFCPLDVALIEVLSKKSPTLIVGDDDQALYAFRDASPQAIRTLAADNAYEKFELPYCTRCTEVLVQAIHTVVGRSQRIGRLSGRLPKPYVCYLPSKRDDSIRYPVIRQVHASTHNARNPYISLVIEAAIRSIDPEEIRESHKEGFPTVLVIGPNPYLASVEAHLRKVFKQVSSSSNSDFELDVLEAYLLLAKHESSNLAWRILAQELQPSGWEDAVRTGLSSSVDLCELLAKSFVDAALQIANLLQRFRAGEELPYEELSKLTDALGSTPTDLESRIESPKQEIEEIDQELPTIVLTSLMGSKGLQAAHVIVVGLNEEHFPRVNNAPTDEEICQLLVALTRARKSCTLVSTGYFAGVQKRKSVFLSWLRPHLGPEEYADKAYVEALKSGEDAAENLEEVELSQA